MKKFYIPVLIILCLALVFSGCTSGGTEKEQIDKIVIGTQEMPNSEGIAKGLNLFEEEFAKAGYEVEVVSFSSGAKVNTALLSGDIDFGLIGTCPVSNGISGGIDMKVIWIHEILGLAESLTVKSDSGIKSVLDLKGKTIATPFASTAHYSVIKALENAGLTEMDVNLLDMQPAEIYAAWGRGDIDAAYVWEPTLSELLASDGEIILTSKDMADAGYMTADIEVVRTEFANNHPELVELYISCLDKAVKLYKEDKPAAISAIAKDLEITEESAEYQANGYEWYTAEEQYEKFFTNNELANTLFDTASFLLEQESITFVPEKETFINAVDSSYMGSYLGK